MFSLGGLKALTNGNMKIHKVLALPPSLEEDSIYFVKNGTGADLYIVDNDGSAIKASSGVDYGLTLGEDATTAYQGDRGKFAYDHAQSPHVANQTDIGLGHVNNTSDLNKPVSTATQAALDALTKTDVGLGNVDNTSDINKPVSTAQQAAIDSAGGGSSFDQDLNTTDSPTFATLNTTNTIATDVFTVDVGATGTVTAGEIAVAGPHGSTLLSARDSSGNLASTMSLTGGGNSQFSLYSSSAALDVVLNTFGGSYLFSSNLGLGTKTPAEKLDVVGNIAATGTVTAGGFVGTPQTLTDAATITYDLSSGHNAKVTITADRTLALPTNLAEGASGVLTLTQDGTGGHALALASGWFVSAGALADITALAANEKAQITWYAYSATNVNATILPLQ